MKKILTLLLLFTLVGFLSANQVIITNDYQYIVSTGKTYNFNNGNPSNNVKYDRTNKIQIQNNKVIANPLKYHYAFFWQEDNTFIGYYKTNKGLTTSGAYLGQVNTQSIPLPLNAYSFALVRYDNDYVLVNGYTIEELFIDNNLAGVDPADFNDIPIAELNGLTLNELFDDNNLILNPTFNDTSNWTASFGTFTVSNNIAIASRTTEVAQVLQQTKTYANNQPKSYYYRFNAKATTGNITSFLFQPYGNGTTILYGNFGTQSFPTLNELYLKTGKIDITQSSTNFTFWYRHNPTNTTLPSTVEWSNIYFIDLSILGINTLSTSTLDTYFNIWQNGVNATYYATDGNVSTVDGYYYAAGKNLFDNTNQQLGQMTHEQLHQMHII
jgi:uncharacterized protein YcfL